MAGLRVQAVASSDSTDAGCATFTTDLVCFVPRAAHSAGSLAQVASVSAMLEGTSALLNHRAQQRQFVHQSMSSHEGHPCQNTGHRSNVNSNLQAGSTA